MSGTNEHRKWGFPQWTRPVVDTRVLQVDDYGAWGASRASLLSRAVKLSRRARAPARVPGIQRDKLDVAPKHRPPVQGLGVFHIVRRQLAEFLNPRRRETQFLYLVCYLLLLLLNTATF